MTTIAITKPPSAPTIHGVRSAVSRPVVGSIATVDAVHTHPTTAVTSSTAKSETVFQIVSSTVIRSVSIAPADGAAYMPSNRALAAASTAAFCAVGAGGGAY